MSPELYRIYMSQVNLLEDYGQQAIVKTILQALLHETQVKEEA